jgi:hypothetical protein
MEQMTSEQIALIKSIFARIFPMVFVLVGALLLYYGAKRVLTAIESDGWPHTSAVVTSSSVKMYISGAARGRTQHQAEIYYEFFVQKRRYIGYHQYESPDAGRVANVIAQYPKGRQITVYYRPDSPGVCLLEPGLRAATLIMPIGGLMFLVPGILLAIFLPRLMKQADRTAEPGAGQSEHEP